MATKIFMKLNTIQSPSSSLPPPDDTNIFNDASPPETRTSPWTIAALVFVFLLFCWCCLPAILRCIAGVVRACWNCVKELLMMVWRMCKKVLRCVCCCCSCSCCDDDVDEDELVRMMIAPGTERALSIPRYVFEDNPQRYFANLRAGTVRMNY